jgi:hypothetical protein
MSSMNGRSQADVVLRLATAEDTHALRRLSELDSSRVPEGPLLIAEVDGTALAAWSPSERRSVADPFHPTAHLVALLRQAAGPDDGPERKAARRLGGLLPGRRAPWPA